MVTTQPRQPAGIPAGGEFAAKSGSAPTGVLTPHAPDWGRILHLASTASASAARRCGVGHLSEDIAADVVASLVRREEENPGWLATVAGDRKTLAPYVAVAVKNTAVNYRRSPSVDRNLSLEGLQQNAPGREFAFATEEEAFSAWQTPTDDGVDYAGRLSDRWRAWAGMKGAPQASIETVHHLDGTKARKTMAELGGVLAAVRKWQNEELSDDEAAALFLPWRKLAVNDAASLPADIRESALAHHEAGTPVGREAAKAYRSGHATPGQLTYLFGGYGVGRPNGRTEASQQVGYTDQELIVEAFRGLKPEIVQGLWESAMASASVHTIRRQKNGPSV